MGNKYSIKRAEHNGIFCGKVHAALSHKVWARRMRKSSNAEGLNLHASDGFIGTQALTPTRVITISESAYLALQGLAIPFEDTTPGLVIERLLREFHAL